MLVILFLSKMTHFCRTLGLIQEKIICERWIAYLHSKKSPQKISALRPTTHKNNNLVFEIIFTGIDLIACAFRYFCVTGEKHSLSFGKHMY